MKIYVATILGALITGLSDVFRFQYSGAVGKVAEGLDIIYAISSGYRYLVAILFLALVSCLIAWLREPCSKACGFLYGAGIITLFSLAVGNPASKVKDSVFNFIPKAYAQANHTAEDKKVPDMIIQFQNEEGKIIEPSTVIIRNKKSGDIVSWKNYSKGVLSIPKGNFIFELSAAGYRRSTGEISELACTGECSFKIDKSSIPSGLQMLYAPASAENLSTQP